MKATITVYLKTGQTFSYEVSAETKEQLDSKVREHMYQIFNTGYRSGQDGFTWYGPHYIDKIKSTHEYVSKYPDSASGT